MINQKSVAFYTLGCKLNFSETSSIGRQLEDNGFRKVEFTNQADLYVINTCSVTDHADRKCKKVVKEALKYNPNAFIVIIGCYAQLKPNEIANIPGVDLVLGAAEKFNLIDHLKSSLEKNDKASIFNKNIKETNIFVPGFSVGDRTRSFLKLQDGCDYFCSFCTIPLARGKSRSHNIEETLDSVRKVAVSGVKEIVLTGVNLGDFGVNHDENFEALIREIDNIEGVDRYRISSIEPNLLSDNIIEFVSSSRKFMPHFHIPLQSGSNTILKSMRRKYEKELYADKIIKIKNLMPHCSIGVDVIVGFPGEGEDEFMDTYKFLNQLDVSYLHVFPYSERKNTTAAKLNGKVHQFKRNERTEMLRILSEKKKQAFYKLHLHQNANVLFENEEKGGKMYGFTENYIKVEVDYDPLLINEITEVELTNINSDGFMNATINYSNKQLLHVS
ncbi:MAG: tRNA (N(6)-L-threonylcarbamoyladenosine(37)-C(2))-methylthiotransferase MtaB [Bacteroidota bacterium]|nr:tRNA (N(6)-L-threonylcarbamoyladenosine(37)-C(2))-methylthiotransferase MtaB [Bacteroidota bacterium]